MLVYLYGPTCVGKRTIAHYLQEHENFKRIPWSRLDDVPDDVEAFSLQSTTTFSTVSQMETFLMTEKRWMSNWVLLANLTVDEFFQLRQRPFVLTVAIDSPLTLRCQRATLPNLDVKDVLQLDAEKWPPSALSSIMIHADMTFINDTLDINLLYSALDKVQFADPERIRPSWDTYFMTLCEWTAHRSNCMKRKVGALLTSDHRILSTGYNGTPFRTLNCNAGGCPRCNDNARAGTHLETCFCLHAEENALLVNSDQNQGHHHHSALTLYCTMFPCIQCAKKIIQCNVVRLVYHRTYASLDTMVLEYFKKSGVHVEMYQEKKKVVKCSDFMKTDLSNGLQVY